MQLESQLQQEDLQQHFAHDVQQSSLESNHATLEAYVHDALQQTFYDKKLQEIAQTQIHGSEPVYVQKFQNSVLHRVKNLMKMLFTMPMFSLAFLSPLLYLGKNLFITSIDLALDRKKQSHFSFQII